MPLAAAATCTFRTNPSGITFTAFDPSVANTRTASTSARVNCTAGGTPTWQLSGANGNSPLRMKHATQSAFIPYSMAVAYVSGGANNQTWNLTATVLGQDYQNALVGSYSDLLTVTILP
jgi:spore coat protein U-like protein